MSTTRARVTASPNAKAMSKKEQIEASGYVPPTHGFLSYLPESWVPYAQLMRIEKPAGLYAFYFPYLIGICYAASIAETPPSLQRIFFLAALFLVQSVFVRGAACAWNDNLDQDLDRKVERCKVRPIARGAVSTSQGNLFTLGLTLAHLPLYYFLPTACLYHAIPIIILLGIYPLGKRTTDFPQVILGFPLAWAIFMSCAALGVDPFDDRHFVPSVSLFVCNILWTIVYDTIYAHQDKQDDKNAGVKSMAVRYAESTKLLASILSVVLVGLLVTTGLTAELSPIYFIGSVGGGGLALASMIATVDLDSPASCAWFFHSGFWYVGGSVAAGFFGVDVERLVKAGALSF